MESETIEIESDNENGEVEAESEETQTIIGYETAQPKITISTWINVCTDPLINKDEKFFDAINGIIKIVSCLNIFENSPYLFEIIAPPFSILAKSSILDV